MNYYLEERKLSEKLCSLLSNEFEIQTEAEVRKSPGKFVLNGREYKSIPDLMLRPKQYLIDSGKFIDTLIPVEIKKFGKLECNKFEDLMFQCHSYRMSSFESQQPKLCLYYIDDYFEPGRPDNAHLSYDYERSKDPKNYQDHSTRNYITDKRKIENLFGRFGIGEIVTNCENYFFRVKRQVLFEKKNEELIFKPNILNFWWGTKGLRKNHQ